MNARASSINFSLFVKIFSSQVTSSLKRNSFFCSNDDLLGKPMAPTILTGPFNVCISRRASSLTVNLPFSSSNPNSGFAGELQQVLLKRETNIKRTSNFKLISMETSNFEDVQFQWVERPMTRTKLQVRRVWYFVIIMREIYMRFCINVLCPSVSVSLLILLNDESIIWEKPPNVFLYFAASWCTKAQSIHRKWLIWKENFGNRTLGDSNHYEIPWFCV